MTKSFSYILCLLSGLLISSCEEVFDMEIPVYVSDALVFEGAVTNERPPYFFHLTRPAGISGDDGKYEGISDARIIITDITEGIRDTLQYLTPYINNHYCLDYYNYDTQCMETFSVLFETAANGIYVTTKIYGIPGHSYSLDIYHKDKHYASEAQTMDEPLLITDLKVIETNLGGKGETNAPCISFTNPPGENYYLFSFYPWSYTHFTFSRPNVLFAGDGTWRYSILSDEYLEENVVDFVIDDGENANNYANGWGYDHEHDSLYVWVQTMSKSCYKIFEQMRKQYYTDGGTYSPTPTNITGNISGGVFGAFRVSAVSEKGISLKGK